MEFAQRVEKRLLHWMEHNDKHSLEYRKLAQELSSKGYEGTASHILRLAEISENMNEEIKKALKDLKGRE